MMDFGECLVDGMAAVHGECFLVTRGYVEQARQVAEAALHAASLLGAAYKRLLQLWNLGVIHYRTADLGRARECFTDVAETCRRLNLTTDEIYSCALYGLGLVARTQAEYSAAHDYFEECLALREAVLICVQLLTLYTLCQCLPGWRVNLIILQSMRKRA